MYIYIYVYIHIVDKLTWVYNPELLRPSKSRPTTGRLCPVAPSAPDSLDGGAGPELVAGCCWYTCPPVSSNMAWWKMDHWSGIVLMKPPFIGDFPWPCLVMFGYQRVPVWTIWKSVGIVKFPTEWKNTECSKPATSDNLKTLVMRVKLCHTLSLSHHNK